MAMTNVSSSKLDDSKLADLDDSCNESRYNVLRRRLDQFGYSLNVGRDSVPLVERLLSDLIHTTDSLRKVKLSNGKENEKDSKKEKDHHEETVEAYRSDNSRLTALVNQLNHQHLKAREQFEDRLKSLKSTIRKLEHENTDLKFLHNQTMEKLQRVESESARRADRIAELQERNLQAVVQTPGGRKAQLAYRRQRMVLEGPLAAAASACGISKAVVPVDPYVADMLQLVEDELCSLRQKSVSLEAERSSHTDTIAMLTIQVEAREAEIQRLQRELESFGVSGIGGKSVDIVTLEAKNRANERLIAQLNIQVDYLQERCRELERQVEVATAESRAALTRSVELDAVNRELEVSIKEVDSAVEKAEREREAAFRSVDYELSTSRVELDQTRRLLREAEHEAARLREAVERFEMENAELRRAVQCREVEVERLSTLSACLKEDKHRLAERVNRLTANERELILELERCQRKSCVSVPASSCGSGGSRTRVKGAGAAAAGGTRPVRAQSPSKIDSWIRELENERDYWRQQVDCLQDVIRRYSCGLPSGITSPRSEKSRLSQRSPSPTKLSQQQPQRQPRSSSKSPERPVAGQQARRRSRSASNNVERATLAASASGIEKQASLLAVERDDLARLVDRLRQQLADVQSANKLLAAERDRAVDVTRRSEDEIRRMANCRPPPATVDLAIRRLEQERDEVVCELRRISAERDALRDRLKMSSEQMLSDRTHAELLAEDQRAVIDSLDRDRAALSTQLSDSRARAEELELIKNRMEGDISRLEADLDRQRSSGQHMKLLLDEAESSVSELRTRLAAKEAALTSSRENEVSQDKRLSELEATRTRLEAEIDRLRSNLLDLDREKDSLSHLVDEKTERSAYLSDELTMANKLNATLRESLVDTQTKLSDTEDALRGKEREVRQTARQLDAALCELKECRTELDNSRRECTRLRDEVAALARESSAFSTDLAATTRERDDLKRQVQEYLFEVQRAEDIMAAKERERQDILDQYRRACGDAESATQHANRLADESVGLRQELELRLTDVNRLRERLRQLEHETRQATQAAHNAELALGSCDRKRCALEEELRQAGAERESLMRDLQAVRDLCAKLETARDALQRQIASKEAEFASSERVCEELRTEVELLRQQVSAERSTAAGIERILHSERQQQYAAENAKQSAQSELELAREKLHLIEAKCESQSSELITLRTRLLDCETELERFRRNLTHERFERERLAQHLRRHGISPPPGAIPPSTVPSSRGISPSRPLSPTRRT